MQWGKERMRIARLREGKRAAPGSGVDPTCEGTHETGELKVGEGLGGLCVMYSEVRAAAGRGIS